MNDLKKGDKVKVKDSYYDPDMRGYTGVITHVKKDNLRAVVNKRYYFLLDELERVMK